MVTNPKSKESQDDLNKRLRSLKIDRGPAPSQERVIAAVATLSAKQQRELADHLERLVEALGVGARAAPMLFVDEPAARPRRAKKRANTRRA